MGFILPWSLFWRWGSVPPSNLVVNKKASGLFRSLAMESMVFYSCFAANFSAISSRRSKVCFSSGYQDHFFAGYDFFRAIVYDTIPVDNHRQTGTCRGEAPPSCYARPFYRLKAPLGLSLFCFAPQTRICQHPSFLSFISSFNDLISSRMSSVQTTIRPARRTIPP